MMCHGTCHGGPYDGKPLAHGELTMRLAYERDRPSRSLPTMQSSADPAIAFGRYTFDETKEIWHWTPAEATPRGVRC